jgi:hypothetical protein
MPFVGSKVNAAVTADKSWDERLRAGYQRFITDFRMTHTVTFNFGPGTGIADAEYAMKGYGTRVERLALGRAYSWRPEPRLAIVGFPEHLETNRHWHSRTCSSRRSGFG